MTRGNVVAAIKWMTSPNPNLEGNTPAEMARTSEGLSEVVACLEARVDPQAHAEYLLSLAETKANLLASLRRPGEPYSEAAMRLPKDTQLFGTAHH
jgi:hypothetical protein